MPVGLAIDPEVLRKAALGELIGGEVDQGAQRRLPVARRQEPHRAVDHVARPDEVITAHPVLIALHLAPRICLIDGNELIDNPFTMHGQKGIFEASASRSSKNRFTIPYKGKTK